MVTTEQRRRVVTHLCAAFLVSARRAMRLVGLSRSRWHYQPRRPPRDAPIRTRRKETRDVAAALRLQAGARAPASGRPRRESQTRVSPLSRGTALRAAAPFAEAHDGAARAVARAHGTERALGMDFIHDACISGRRFRCLTKVDEFIRVLTDRRGYVAPGGAADRGSRARGGCRRASCRTKLYRGSRVTSGIKRLQANVRAPL